MLWIEHRAQNALRVRQNREIANGSQCNHENFFRRIGRILYFKKTFDKGTRLYFYKLSITGK